MKEDFNGLKDSIGKQKKIIAEINNLFKGIASAKDNDEREIISGQIKSLKNYLKKVNEDLDEALGDISLVKPLKKAVEISEPVKKVNPQPIKIPEIKFKGKAKLKDFELSDIEKLTLKRLKKRKKKEKKKKLKKPSWYLKLSNRIFSGVSTDLIKEPFFNRMRRNVIKSNLELLPRSYLSLVLFSTSLSIIVSIFLVLFFLFFNFVVQVPFVTRATEELGFRFARTFWILFVVPIVTFFTLYVYPGLERKSDETKINQELPFATIHMSAVSGSLIDPTRIFSILVSTGDYPNVSKQFTKLLNQINLQGYSLVNSLRNTAFNGPSERLSELMNGLATTITSGGDLPNFFDKRAQSLLLEHKLEKEKYAKTAETFMDIYISVVIAAPMILMLLLIMMRISGIGIGFSTGMISLIMSLGVSTINFAFLVFLHIRSATVGA